MPPARRLIMLSGILNAFQAHNILRACNNTRRALRVGWIILLYVRLAQSNLCTTQCSRRSRCSSTCQEFLLQRNAETQLASGNIIVETRPKRAWTICELQLVQGGPSSSSCSSWWCKRTGFILKLMYGTSTRQSTLIVCNATLSTRLIPIEEVEVAAHANACPLSTCSIVCICANVRTS